MLNNIKLLLGLTDNTKDELIELLIMQATDEAKDFTHREDVSILSSTIAQMVIWKYNRMGTEGLNSESYSGVSYNYAQDYPDSIMRTLKRYRKLIVL